MRIKPSAYFVIFLLLLGLFGIGMSLTFQYLAAILLPLLLSSVIFVLAAIQLSKELRSRDKEQTATEEKPQPDVETRVELRRFGSAIGWLAGFVLAIYLLGFLIAIPLFVFSYLKGHGRGWLTAIVLAVIAIGLIYGIFEFGLKAYLYRGLLFS